MSVEQKVRNYQDLIAWQKSMDLVAAIYSNTQSFPAEERYGLSSQIRRAAVSVPSNIAEGQGRGSDAEFVRFLNIAHGSLREIETQILIAQRLAYFNATQTETLLADCSEVGKLLNGLIRSIKLRTQ